MDFSLTTGVERAIEAVQDTVVGLAEPATKGTIILAGFWGRGNAGDEAMLQCAIETLGSEFDYAISVHSYGAKEGFHDWYPYQGRQIIEQNDADALPRIARPLGVMVGGGGLPIGFAGGQLVAARAAGLRTAMAGIEIWKAGGDPNSSMAQEMRRWLGALDACYTRSQRGYETAVQAGCGDDVHWGGDWALNLPTDEAPGILDQPGRVLIVPREGRIEDMAPDYREQVLRLLERLCAEGLVPSFLPFAPEDERFIGEVGLGDLAPTISAWSNPRRMKQLIARSGMMVSLGRLHPLIFGAPTNCSMACIATPQARKGIVDRKLSYMCEEFDLPIYGDVDAFIAALPDATRQADPLRVAVSKARLDVQADHLRRVFAHGAASRSPDLVARVAEAEAEIERRDGPGGRRAAPRSGSRPRGIRRLLRPWAA